MPQQGGEHRGVGIQRHVLLNAAAAPGRLSGRRATTKAIGFASRQPNLLRNVERVASAQFQHGESKGGPRWATGVLRTPLAGELTEQVIGFAIEVHRYTGPVLPESDYEQCLWHELREADIPFER